ncbi:ATP-dependent (S)-NAD(P)H-hydrate dehydratase [Daphnia magna]|uniref:ATP-dependent (S)-NAD(P)H-hydrate dehydratase n=2 Tax=Daphnia magna TaxID=35525 RepID=A0A0P5W5Q4_9CRUS|nr:ATP-dependent (S)-NAD(P)H-hydrate dehydratase [Daphnia magna]KAK4018388.1 hypothetical protein OUZ56_000448 [Daphnia magna]KZS08685.1 ATP-dependent (S)-NAD(P)H-hydrate dehydratase [Daphnia magna]
MHSIRKLLSFQGIGALSHLNCTEKKSSLLFVKPTTSYCSPPTQSTIASMQTLSKEILLLEMKKSIPILSNSLHKGESGRIGVIGGSLEYTGAPYFAAISALRVGCDLVHVFCMKEAAPVIKSYSPELIVHPLLDSSNALKAISEWLPRIHALIIGPGLGRDEATFKVLGPIINHAKELKIPLVIDADGLFYINSNHHIIQNCTNVILTPNTIEFTRLYKAIMGITIDPSQPVQPEDVGALAKKLGHVTILQKAEKDIITNGININICEKMGSPRRCGGQGDLMSGMLATFLYWKTHDQYSHEVTLSAAAAAAHLSRMINRKAFEIHGRGTLASDMIPYIPECFRSLFNQE